jgi:hypothetical protein
MEAIQQQEQDMKEDINSSSRRLELRQQVQVLEASSKRYDLKALCIHFVDLSL